MTTQQNAEKENTLKLPPTPLPSIVRYKSSSSRSARPTKSMVRIKSIKPNRIVLTKTK